MFELQQQNCKIAHVNIREEQHGDEKVKAIDLKVEAKMPNDFLSQLHPTLKWSLYDKPSDAQGVLVEDKNHLPTLRYPKMGTPLKWEGDIKGGLLVVHAPISKNDLKFTVDVGDLRLMPLDGGTVTACFRASFYPKDEKEIGKTCALLGQQVEISVEPPKADPEPGEDGAGK